MCLSAREMNCGLRLQFVMAINFYDNATHSVAIHDGCAVNLRFAISKSIQEKAELFQPIDYAGFCK